MTNPIEAAILNASSKTLAGPSPKGIPSLASPLSLLIFISLNISLIISSLWILKYSSILSLYIILQFLIIISKTPLVNNYKFSNASSISLSIIRVTSKCNCNIVDGLFVVIFLKYQTFKKES